MHVLVTYKFKMDLINSDREKVATSIFSDQIQPRKRGDAVFPIITLWELSVAMETRV